MRSFVALLLPMFVTTSAYCADSQRVAVVASVDPGQISVPTVELYHAVNSAVRESKSWRPSSARDVKLKIKAPQALTNLASIPAVARGSFVKAKNVKKGSKGEAKARVIAPVQAMLDTMALDGAIIVDCAPNPQLAGNVDACGLYYYDRAAGRIIAATQKSFRVAINDATSWATSLVGNLDQGMVAHASRSERDKLDRVLAESPNSDAPSQLGIELDLVGYSVSEPLSKIQSLPGAALIVGPQAKGYAAGLELGIAEATMDDALGTVSFRERSLGLQFAVQSRALEMLLWDFGLGLHVADIKAQAENRGKLDQRAVKLRVEPGVLWEMNKSLQFGASVSYDRVVPVSGSSQGAYDGKSLARNVFGFGIRLRSVL